MLRTLTYSERRTIWWLATIGAVSRLILAFRSDALLATRPYVEDAFYLFSCARNIALGRGFAVDGVHLTNGVQPLICLLYAPFFWLTTDPWAAVRLTFILTAVIQFIGVMLIARLMVSLRRRQQEIDAWWQSPSVISALLWVIATPLLIHNTNGLETGLTADLILASLVYYDRSIATSFGFGKQCVFGLLLGFAVLARIDCVFLVVAFAVYELVRSWKEGIPRVIAFGSVAVIISMPWWIYNLQTFGSVMPMSGQSESLGFSLSQNAMQTVAALDDMLMVLASHNSYGHGLTFTIHLIVLFVLVQLWAFVFRSYKLGRWFRVRYYVKPLVPLVLFSLALVIYYNLFFSAPHFIARYLNPLRILWTIVVAGMVPILLEIAARKKPPVVVRLLAISAVSIGVVFSLWRYAVNFTTSHYSELYLAGLWAKQHPASSIGMDQSGTTGFMSPNIVNLDGKVNPEALAARQHGTMPAYLKRQHFDYLADWKQIVTLRLEETTKAGMQYSLDSTIGPVMIYKRVSP